MGLYSVLWGKYKEYKENEVEAILEPVKDNNISGNNGTMMMMGDIEANNDLEMQKINEANRAVVIGSAFAISTPVPSSPMIAFEAPKN